MARPIILTALATKSVFGGFIIELSAFANIAKYFPGRVSLNYVYHDERPYKRTLIQLCPQVDQAFNLEGYDLPARLLSRQGLKGGKIYKQPPVVREALEGALKWTDLLLTNNLRTGYTNLRPHARFRIPAELEGGLEADLKARGVDPGRFIVVFHCREDGYALKGGYTGSIRNVDPRRYYEVMKHVIMAQGGQVVRIGDPAMTPLPKTPGLVDLSREKDILLLQAYAISRARYAVCTDSGVLPLAAAFQTPMLAADVTNANAFPYYPEHAVLTKTYIDPEGGESRQADAYAAGHLYSPHDRPPPGYSVRGATLKKLIAGVDRLHELTEGVEGWRTPPDEPVHTPRADMFDLLAAKPLRTRSDVNFL